MRRRTSPRRHLLLAGGLVAVALSHRAGRSLGAVRAAARRALSASDPVAPFLEAPCERATAASGQGLRVEDATE